MGLGELGLKGAKDNLCLRAQRILRLSNDPPPKTPQFESIGFGVYANTLITRNLRESPKSKTLHPKT